MQKLQSVHRRVADLAKLKWVLALAVLLIAFARLADAAELHLSPDAPVPAILPHMMVIDGTFDLTGPDGRILATTALANATEQTGHPEKTLTQDIWYAVTVRNTGTSPGRWRLDTKWFQSVGIEAYMIRSGDVTLLLKDKPSVGRITDRTVPQRRLVSPFFELEAGASAQIWVRYLAPPRLKELLSLQTEASYYGSTNTQQLIDGLYFGLGLALVIFFALIAIVLRFRTAAFYSAFFVTLLIMDLSTAGYIAQVLHPNTEGSFFVYYTLIRMLCAITYFSFVSSFIDDKSATKIFDLVWIIFILCVVVLVTCLIWAINQKEILGNEYWNLTLGILFYIFLALVIFGAVMAIRLGVSGGWLLMLGLVPFLATGLVRTWTYDNVVPLSWVDLDKLVKVTRLSDSIIFGIAVVLRLMAIRRDRDAARMRAAKAAVDRDAARMLAEAHKDRLSTTSHDLRQPLMSLRLALDKEDAVPAHLRENLTTSLSYLKSVLDQILSDTRASEETAKSGPQATVQSEPIPLQIILQNSLRMFQGEAEEKGLQLRMVDTSVIVAAEPVALIRMVSNLVSNAVKYTKEGRILIGVRRRGDTYSIEVHDTGPGLTEVQMRDIRQSYHRSETSLGTQGEGIGITSVEMLATESNLSLSIQSRLGAGSCFALNGLQEMIVESNGISK